MFSSESRVLGRCEPETSGNLCSVFWELSSQLNSNAGLWAGLLHLRSGYGRSATNGYVGLLARPLTVPPSQGGFALARWPLENSIASTSIFVLQATKSQRWMPWRLEPKKDVGKLR